MLKMTVGFYLHQDRRVARGDWRTNSLLMEKFLHFAKVFEKKYQKSTPLNFFHTKILKFPPSKNSWLRRIKGIINIGLVCIITGLIT